jgi:cysteine sulfinate desulfinase/cysteine desulfurase-like protein
MLPSIFAMRRLLLYLRDIQEMFSTLTWKNLAEIPLHNLSDFRRTRAKDKARRDIGHVIGCNPNEITFTFDGT